jgi:hypothetical protein
MSVNSPLRSLADSRRLTVGLPPNERSCSSCVPLRIAIPLRDFLPGLKARGVNRSFSLLIPSCCFDLLGHGGKVDNRSPAAFLTASRAETTLGGKENFQDESGWGGRSPVIVGLVLLYDVGYCEPVGSTYRCHKVSALVERNEDRRT